MSLQEQARKLIEQAEVAIRADNAQYATELLRQSILYNGKDADAYILLGVALAQCGMPGDAENAFKKATHLAPESVKARYNLAVHQYSQGQVRAALNSARKAAEIDVRHLGAKNLVARIEGELGIEPGEQPKTTAAGNPTPPQFHSGYEQLPVETIPVVTRLGAAWNVIPWVISAVSLAGLIMCLKLAPTIAANGGQTDSLIRAMNASPMGHVVAILYFSTILLGVAWTAMDAIHRGGNLLWMLPQVFCGCLGFGWIILPLYFFVGRNNSTEAPTT